MYLNICNLGIQRVLEIFKHCKYYTTILFIGFHETIGFYCTFSRKVLWWNIIKLNMHELMIIWTQHSLNSVLKKYLFLFFKYVIIRPKNCKRLMLFVLINKESIKKELVQYSHNYLPGMLNLIFVHSLYLPCPRSKCHRLDSSRIKRFWMKI